MTIHVDHADFCAAGTDDGLAPGDVLPNTCAVILHVRQSICVGLAMFFLAVTPIEATAQSTPSAAMDEFVEELRDFIFGDCIIGLRRSGAVDVGSLDGMDRAREEVERVRLDRQTKSDRLRSGFAESRRSDGDYAQLCELYLDRKKPLSEVDARTLIAALKEQISDHLSGVPDVDPDEFAWVGDWNDGGIGAGLKPLRFPERSANGAATALLTVFAGTTDGVTVVVVSAPHDEPILLRSE